VLAVDVVVCPKHSDNTSRRLLTARRHTIAANDNSAADNRRKTDRSTKLVYIEIGERHSIGAAPGKAG
jgi:hypothetical protein